MQDVKNTISVAQSLVPAARTTNATGTGVDLAGYGGACVIVTTGVITDGTHTVAVQESTDNSTFTAVAAADLDGTNPVIAPTDDNTAYEVGYKGTKRYLRTNVTCPDGTTGGVYSTSIVRTGGRKQPV